MRDLALFDRYREGVESAVVGGPVVPAWSPDGKLLIYLDGAQAWQVELASGDRTSVAPESVLAQLAGGDGREYLRNVATLDPQPAVELASPDGQWLVSTADGAVVRRRPGDEQTVALTPDEGAHVDYRFDWNHPALGLLGMASPVCDFSPDSRQLAVYRVDCSEVSRSVVTDRLGREDTVAFHPVAKAGGPVERYSLHVLDVATGETVPLDLGNGDSTYPLPVAWTPDGRQLVLAVFSRDCRTARVLLADAATGASRELFSETCDTFLRVHHDLYFTKKAGLFLTPDGTSLLWLSERSGSKQLYRYSIDGTLVGALTEGELPVEDVHLITDTHVYLTAHTDPARPYDTHVVRVPLEGGPRQQLTHEVGVHRAVFAPSGEAFVDTWSTPYQPPRSALRASDGSLVAELTAGQLVDLPWTPPQQFTVTAADGETELWGVMFFPYDFDERSTYPLVEYVYAGPQVAAAPHEFGGHFARDAHALAQLGYITVVVDGRGTPGRSKAFHDVVHKDWYGGLLGDHVAAVEQLRARHPFIAGGPIGVMGDSWGGHSAFRLALERPDLYAAAVCTGPGFDPWASVLYEPYLGQPQEDPAPYDAASCVRAAAGLQAELLIVSGTADFFSWSDALKVSEQLVLAGKQHELVVLPGQGHALDPAHDRYVGHKYAAFFDRHLPGTSCSGES